MKFKIWIILLFATSGHGFLTDGMKKFHDWIGGSVQGPADVNIEKHQESSNHGSYGNFEHPGAVYHESFDESHSEVHGADSRDNLNLGLSVGGNINFNFHEKISKIFQSGTNLTNKLYNSVKNKKVLDYIPRKQQRNSSERSKVAQIESQRGIRSHYAGSYGKSVYGEAVREGQESKNQESAAKNQKSFDSDSKYYGYDSKSTSIDKDSSFEKYDGQYQRQDPKLFNSDTGQYQEHESTLSFGLNNQNYPGFDSYNNYAGYQSGNQQLVSSYASGPQGYGSEVQSNVEQGHPDEMTIEQILGILEGSKKSNSGGFYEHNKIQYSSDKDRAYEQFPRDDYSQSQSLEEPGWSKRLQDNDFADHTVKVNTDLQNLKHFNNEELKNDGPFDLQTHESNFANGKNKVFYNQQYGN